MSYLERKGVIDNFQTPKSTFIDQFAPSRAFIKQAAAKQTFEKAKNVASLAIGETRQK